MVLVAMVDASYECYVGQWPLLETYLIYPTFRELALQVTGCYRT
jgi:hypothetical protein